MTGGTGFIGRRLVRRLIEIHGASSIACLVKASAKPPEAAALDCYRSAGVALIEGDLLSRPVSVEPAPRVDVVFHLAANIDTDAGAGHHTVNDLGTRNLVEWLAPMMDGVRVVYSSTVAVHDRLAHPSAPIDERSPFTPRTIYGATKLQGEVILRERAAVDGFSWTILRLPTVYGPGQKASGLFDTLAKLASEGRLLGRIDWPGRTSIIYVDDLADAMIDMASRTECAGEAYCVASDESLTVGRMAQIVGRAIERPVRPIAIPPLLLRMMRAFVWNRSVWAMLPRLARAPIWRLSVLVSDGFWFDTAKFRRVYTKPIRNLEEGLADTIRPTSERSRGVRR